MRRFRLTRFATSTSAIAVASLATALTVGSCKADPTGTGTTATASIEFINAAALPDVAPWIASEVARATNDNTRVLVYVGASWCEPCETFHRAAQAGKLNAALPKLRLLSFDADRDSDALGRAGYASEMIPLFAEARADGQASGRKIMGSVKGDAAISDLTPRILSLLAPPQ